MPSLVGSEMCIRDRFNNVFGLVISKMVLAPEPSGFPDDIAQPVGELRVRLFTAHFASFCATAFSHEASSDRENCAVTLFCAVFPVRGGFMRERSGAKRR